MDNNSTYSIEDYLDGLLNPEEKEQFEAQVEQNSDLAKLLEEELEARELIRVAGRLDLKESLENFDAEMELSTPSGKVMPLWVKRFIPIAAMLVISIGVFQYYMSSTTVTQAFDTYFETYEAPSIERNSSGSIRPNWDTAAQYYKIGSYQEALVHFSNATNEMPNYLVSFYTGMSAMSQENPDYAMAVNQFLKVRESDNDYVQQADWYRGLALLKMGEEDKAKAVFYDIIEKKSYEFEKAKKLIKLRFK